MTFYNTQVALKFFVQERPLTSAIVQIFMMKIIANYSQMFFKNLKTPFN